MLVFLKTNTESNFYSLIHTENKKKHGDSHRKMLSVKIGCIAGP